MKYESSTHTPIQFRTLAPVRFTDIDRYGHVATSHYIEYLFTSRFDYLRDNFQLMPEMFIKKGVGFVTRRMEWDFFRPIPATQTHIAIESFTPLVEDSKFIVEFKILHPDGDPTYARGSVDFRCIDLKAGAPCPMPDWLLRCFFEVPELAANP
jgi:YbgC/YbaW family acyl-CoA thioester hydrolase